MSREELCKKLQNYSFPCSTPTINLDYHHPQLSLKQKDPQGVYKCFADILSVGKKTHKAAKIEHDNICGELAGL